MPEGTGAVYLAASLPELGPWRAEAYDQNLFDPRIADTGIDWGVDGASSGSPPGERSCPSS